MKTDIAMDLKINQRYYDNFSEHISIREDRIKLWWKEAIRFTFQDIVLSEKVILEIGAGKGFLEVLYPFTPERLMYTEISFNRFRMNKYKRLFPDRSVGVFNDANFPCFQPERFDYIIFINCLMFIENKVELIEQYKLFLKKNGSIIIMEPLDGNPFYKIRKKFSPEYDKVRMKNITYNDIERICRKSITVKKRYFFFLSILTASLRLKFPDNMLIKTFHHCWETIDKYILKVRKMQQGAVLACVVIKRY